MADDGTKNTGLPPNPQAAADAVKQHNQQVATKLEDQGRQYDDPAALDDTSNALDDLARQSGEGSAGAPGGDGTQGNQADGTEGGAGEGGEGGQAGDGDGGQGGGEGDAGGEGGEGDLVQKKEGDDDGDGGSDTPDDAGGDGGGDGGTGGGDGGDGDQGQSFDDVQLPDTATPKSSEAFQLIKDRAKAQIEERDRKITDLERERDEWKGKAEQGLPPEQKQELEQLREFRSKLDVEFDPKFREYDAKISSNSDFIYAQLEKAGIQADVIAKIKEFGGPHKVKMDKILDTIDDSTTKRIVSSKLADIEQADFEKKQAIDSAKANLDEYTRERNEAIEKGASQHRDTARTILDKDLLPKFDFFKEPAPLKDGATEDEKKLHGAQKEWYANAKKQVEFALSDDSPQMRAILVAGVVKMLHLDNMVRGSKAIIESKDEAIKALTKERDEAVAVAEKLKKGSVSRRDRSNAGSAPNPNPTNYVDPNLTAEDALDAIAKNLQQQQRSGGVS